MSKKAVWYKGSLVLIVVSFAVTVALASVGRTNSGQYVGSEACNECHEEEYSNFKKFAKKSRSGESVKIMAPDLTKAELADCYTCHMTGYGKPGGFVSFEDTPKLADCGCEVCHGPGYDHIESGGDSELIKGKLSMEDCQTCHNPERVDAFDFKPLLYGGAH